MKRQSKILLVLFIPPPFGGGEILSSYLYQFFRNNRRYITCVVSRNYSNKSRQGKLSLFNLIWSFKIVVRSMYYLMRFRPTILFMPLPTTFLPFFRTLLIILFARILKSKVLTELPGAGFMFFHKNGAQRQIGVFALKKICCIRVLGKQIQNNLRQLNIDRTTVIDNGVSISTRFNPAPNDFNDNVLHLLYVGSLEFSKGLYNSIQSLIYCKKNQLQFQFNVVGEWVHPFERKIILDLIRVNELENHVKFYGLVVDDRKWNIIAKNAILLHPTFWDGQPLTILEAMGCGLAIITTPVGAIPDTIEHGKNGIILKENTPEKIYEAIKVYYDNREELVKVSQNNIATFNERFTLDRYLNNMQKWFESYL